MKTRLTSRGRDLLGRPVRTRKSGFQSQLEQLDRATLAARVGRLRHLAEVHPGKVTFMCPPEMFYLLDEVKSTFVNGEHTSTLLLATAFIEHWLSGILHAKGLHKESTSGLAGIVACMRRRGIGHEFILTKIDRLRLVRNPFSHLKHPEHEHKIDRRSVNQRTHPHVLMEQDAREAVSLVYTVAMGRY